MWLLSMRIQLRCCVHRRVAGLPRSGVSFPFVFLPGPQSLPYTDIKRCCRLTGASSGLICEEAEARATCEETRGKGTCAGCWGGDGKSCDARHRCARLASRDRGSPPPLHWIAQHTETTQFNFLGKKLKSPVKSPRME